MSNPASRICHLFHGHRGVGHAEEVELVGESELCAQEVRDGVALLGRLSEFHGLVDAAGQILVRHARHLGIDRQRRAGRLTALGKVAGRADGVSVLLAAGQFSKEDVLLAFLELFDEVALVEQADIQHVALRVLNRQLDEILRIVAEDFLEPPLDRELLVDMALEVGEIPQHDAPVLIPPREISQQVFYCFQPLFSQLVQLSFPHVRQRRFKRHLDGQFHGNFTSSLL